MIPMILMAIEDDADRAFMINLYEQCHKAMYRQAYDILRDHGAEPARSFELGELDMRRIGLCLGKEHFILIKTVEFLGVALKKAR